MVTSKKTQPKTKRQLTEEALQAALGGNWEEAVALNDAILERFPREAEAMNRKGRALIELQQLTAAREAYSEALKADPANMIARRNLQRLETLYNRAGGEPKEGELPQGSIPRANVFIEEIGKTWVDELANPADPGQLAEVAPGSPLKIEPEDGKLVVSSQEGMHLGEIEEQMGARLLGLIESGNRYEAYALGLSGHSLRIILREVYKDPQQGARHSFPPQTRQIQDLMRERELLFQREEGDFDFGDEDEDELLSDEIDVSANEEEEDDAGIDSEPDGYIEDSGNDEDEEAEL